MSFACNDARNGMFAGRAWMAHPESLYRVGRHPWDAELVHDDWGRGVVLTVDHARMRLRIHRVWFGFKAHRPMFGNWCWDAFEFERRTGKRLLALMRERGDWHCEAGPSSFYRWWNRRPNVGGEVRLAAHQPSQTTTATPQGVASTDQLGRGIRSEELMANGSIAVQVDVLNLEPVKKLHEAVCQAVALLNRAPELARSTEGREAHNLLRQALVDVADAYMDTPVTESERAAVAAKHQRKPRVTTAADLKQQAKSDTSCAGAFARARPGKA